MDKPTSKLVDLRTNNKFNLGDIVSARPKSYRLGAKVYKTIEVVFSNGYKLIAPPRLYDEIHGYMMMNESRKHLNEIDKKKEDIIKELEGTRVE